MAAATSLSSAVWSEMNAQPISPPASPPSRMATNATARATGEGRADSTSRSWGPAPSGDIATMLGRDPARAPMLARMRTLVVVPTYNEASGIELVLKRIREELPGAEILVVDDNSPDGTGELVEAVGAADPMVSPLRRPARRGPGSAYLAGFAEGLERGFGILVEMDADLSHDPVALPALVSATTHGADVAIGSRYVAGGSIPDWTWRRAFLSRWSNRYAALVLGLAVNDSTSGYRAYRADALRRLDLGHVRAYGYGFQVEMTYRLIRQGGRVVEIPVAFVDRRAGESKMSLPIVLEAFVLVTGWGLRDVLTGARRRRAVAARGVARPD